MILNEHLDIAEHFKNLSALLKSLFMQNRV